MTTIRLALNELRRITSGRLPPLATLALVLVPLIYGSMYLYANYDPYGNLGKIPAAIVVADKGSTINNKPLNAGNEVADELVNSHSFAWSRTDAGDAASGVNSGKYTFSITLPSDFSSALTSSAGNAPRQGLIELTTNDANNYLAGTIADKVVDNVRDAVTKKVGNVATNRLLLGFSSTHDQLSKAADAARQLSTGANKARDGSAKLADGITTLNTGQQKLASGTATLATGANTLSTKLNSAKKQTESLPQDASTLASGAKKVADGNATAADAAQQVAAASGALSGKFGQVQNSVRAELSAHGVPDDEIDRVAGILNNVSGPLQQANSGIQDAATKLNTLAAGAQKVSDGAASLSDAAPGLSDGIAQAADGASQLNTGATQARDGAKSAADGTTALVAGSTQLRTGNAQLADGANKLQQGLGAGVNGVPNPNGQSAQDTANNVSNPVAVRSVGDAKASTYGAGLAPFFLSLAMWIGAFTLFLLLQPLSRRALAAGASAWKIAVGGWLPSAVLSVAQAIALYVVVVFAVGVTPSEPVLTGLFLIVVGICFTALVHGLNALLGTIGKFVALVLLVLQLVSAGGTFPWQTLPGVLQPLHLIFPMSYAVDGLRHLFYGGSLDGIPLDLGVLVLWGLFGIALGTIGARNKRIWTASSLRPELAI